MGSVVCWGTHFRPGAKVGGRHPLASFLGSGAENQVEVATACRHLYLVVNLADSSGVCLTPLVSAVAQELTRAAQRALEAAAAISSQSPEGME